MSTSNSNSGSSFVPADVQLAMAVLKTINHAFQFELDVKMGKKSANIKNQMTTFRTMSLAEVSKPIPEKDKAVFMSAHGIVTSHFVHDNFQILKSIQEEGKMFISETNGFLVAIAFHGKNKLLVSMNPDDSKKVFKWQEELTNDDVDEVIEPKEAKD